MDNVGRLYVRRILEIASFSAATMASTTSMEAMAMIEKPKEWSTIDLAEQRRQFGQNISSLGKTSISRVWAAGKFSLDLFSVVLMCVCFDLFHFISYHSIWLCFITAY